METAGANERKSSASSRPWRRRKRKRKSKLPDQQKGDINEAKVCRIERRQLHEGQKLHILAGLSESAAKELGGVACFQTFSESKRLFLHFFRELRSALPKNFHLRLIPAALLGGKRWPTQESWNPGLVKDVSATGGFIFVAMGDDRSGGKLAPHFDKHGYEDMLNYRDKSGRLVKPGVTIGEVCVSQLESTATNKLVDVMLDAQGRNKYILVFSGNQITTTSMKQISDAQLLALWTTAACVGGKRFCDMRLNQGTFQNIAHLHLKIEMPLSTWHGKWQKNWAWQRLLAKSPSSRTAKLFKDHVKKSLNSHLEAGLCLPISWGGSEEVQLRDFTVAQTLALATKLEQESKPTKGLLFAFDCSENCGARECLLVRVAAGLHAFACASKLDRHEISIEAQGRRANSQLVSWRKETYHVLAINGLEDHMTLQRPVRRNSVPPSLIYVQCASCCLKYLDRCFWHVDKSAYFVVCSTEFYAALASPRTNIAAVTAPNSKLLGKQFRARTGKGSTKADETLTKDEKKDIVKNFVDSFVVVARRWGFRAKIFSTSFHAGSIVVSAQVEQEGVTRRKVKPDHFALRSTLSEALQRRETLLQSPINDIIQTETSWENNNAHIQNTEKSKTTVGSRKKNNTKIRPSHFLALRLPSDSLRACCVKIVDTVTLKNSHLRSAAVDPITLHLTLFVLSLQSEKEISKAKSVMAACAEDALVVFGNRRPWVALQGLGQFRKDVLLFKAAPESGVAAIKRFVSKVRKKFIAAGLLAGDEGAPFKAHATIMKTSKMRGKRASKVKQKKAILKAPEDFSERFYGMHAFKELELNSMVREANGYYKTEALLRFEDTCHNSVPWSLSDHFRLRIHAAERRFQQQTRRLEVLGKILARQCKV